MKRGPAPLLRAGALVAIVLIFSAHEARAQYSPAGTAPPSGSAAAPAASTPAYGSVPAYGSAQPAAGSPWPPPLPSGGVAQASFAPPAPAPFVPISGTSAIAQSGSPAPAPAGAAPAPAGATPYTVSPYGATGAAGGPAWYPPAPGAQFSPAPAGVSIQPYEPSTWSDGSGIQAAVVPPSPNPWDDHFWFGMDYLMWWAKGDNSPPLITEGNPYDYYPGALGQPGTNVMFGGTGISPGMFSGVRLGGGYWFNDLVGLEASGFTLFQRTLQYGVNSDSYGMPVIARPVENVPSQIQYAYPDSWPGYQIGSSAASFTSMLVGYDLSLAFKAVRAPGFAVDGFVGYRQLNLKENLTVEDATAELQSGVLTFGGAAINPGAVLTDWDSFSTWNAFYGPQVGGRINWGVDRWNFNVLGKLAMGVTQEVVTINGSSTLYSPGSAPAALPGGILAQNSNIGRYYSEQFAVIPELGLNVGYQITPNVQLRFGYSFLFWSNVARPGEQIDTRVNGNNVPTDSSYGTAPGGPALPGFTFMHTTYWAQGLNFGLEYRR